MPPVAPWSRTLDIALTWDGKPVPEGERVRVALERDDAGLRVRFDAPHRGDPRPAVPPGSVDGLWEFEVVELMLLGADDRYLELEFGPGGHYLALELHGVRNVVRRGMAIRYDASVTGSRWTGEARVPAELLPASLDRANAYAIRGTGAGRRYLCHAATLGDRPDFHRLGAFVPLGGVSDPERGS